MAQLGPDTTSRLKKCPIPVVSASVWQEIFKDQNFHGFHDDSGVVRTCMISGPINKGHALLVIFCYE